MGELQRVEIHSQDTGAEAPVAPTKETPRAPDDVTISEERPQWLPEKFKSPEDLATAYAQLEQRLGGAPADKNAPAAPKAPAQAEGILSDAEMEVFSREVVTQGGLSEASYEQLTKKGFPRTLVDQYVEGLQAVTAQKLTSVYDAVGGAENYKDMTQWALANLTPDQIHAYNRTVENADVHTAMLAVKGLHAEYVAQRGNAPRLLQGKAGAASGAQPFRSREEMVTAMKDPRYKSDPAYRADVERRLERANIF